MNYKNGRFCQDHLLEGLDDICGIYSCGQPVSPLGSLICENPAHCTWYEKYCKRFKRMTFPGVQRVIQAQQTHAIDALMDSSTPVTSVPFHAHLPELEGITGNEIIHTF